MHPLWKKGKTLKGQPRGLRPVFTLPPALDFVPTGQPNVMPLSRYQKYLNHLRSRNRLKRRVSGA